MQLIEADRFDQLKKCLYLCQINLDLYENLNLSSWRYQTIIPTCITHMGYPQTATKIHGGVQIIKKYLYLCQINSELYET